MKSSIRNRLEQLARRLVEVDALLAEPEIAGDMNRYRKMSRERSELEPVVTAFAAYTGTEEDIQAAQDMMSDPEMRDMAEEEYKLGKDRLEQLAADLRVLLLPRDPDDGRSVFLEIRAGTGGDESALFAGDLLRMYT
ncbi:MAG: PCRF domain-containing protein, partial [Pollutimonas bauzanensis]